MSVSTPTRSSSHINAHPARPLGERRPHPDVLTAMHDDATRGGGGGGNAAATSYVLVPTVGPATPRPPHRMSLLSLRDEVTRNNHPLSLHAMADLVRSHCPR